MPDLMLVYEHVLGAANLKVNDEGMVSVLYGEDRSPFFVDKKRLVLPTKHQLNKPGWEERIAFHPGQEDIMAPESKVLVAYRKQVTRHLQTVALAVMAELLIIASSQAMHSKLSPDQAEILRDLQHVNGGTLETFIKLGKAATSGDPTESFLTLYMKKSAKLERMNYRRAAIATFPLYEALVKDGAERQRAMEIRKEQGGKKGEPIPNETFGVHLSIKDRESLIKLHEYIFPNIESQHAYSAGSNSDIMPSMDALMQSVGKIGGAINDVIDGFSNVRPTLEAIRIEGRWMQYFLDLPDLLPAIRMIPMLSGNGSGEPVPVPVEKQATPTSAPVHTPTPHPAQHHPVPPVHHAPVHTAPPPAPPPRRNGVTAAEIFGQPVYQPQYVRPGQPSVYGQPQPGYPQSPYQQPQAPQYVRPGQPSMQYGQPQPQYGYGGPAPIDKV